MRALLIVPFLTVSLLAGEDDWKVEVPESKPEGEPVRLTFARTSGTVVRGELTRTMTETTPVGRNEVVTALALRMSFGEADARGLTPIRVSLRVRRMEENGEDLTETLPTRDGTLSALLEPAGKFLPGIEARGIGELFEGDVSALIVAGGDRTVRKGEVWEIVAPGMGDHLTSVRAKESSITSYATLEDVEERDGVRCARIRSVLVARLDGVQMEGDANGRIRMRNERVEWLGMDGVLRGRTEVMKARMFVGGVAAEMEARSELTAGPEKAPAEEKKEEAEAPSEPGHQETK